MCNKIVVRISHIVTISWRQLEEHSCALERPTKCFLIYCCRCSGEHFVSRRNHVTSYTLRARPKVRLIFVVSSYAISIEHAPQLLAAPAEAITHFPNSCWTRLWLLSSRAHGLSQTTGLRFVLKSHQMMMRSGMSKYL